MAELADEEVAPERSPLAVFMICLLRVIGKALLGLTIALILALLLLLYYCSEWRGPGAGENTPELTNPTVDSRRSTEITSSSPTRTRGAVERAPNPHANLIVHSAEISSEPGLPPGTVRDGMPAILSYRLRPARELTGASLRGAVSASLLEAIATGVDVQISFACNFCKQSDGWQPAQRLVLDPAAVHHDRSLPINFHFTPQAMSRPGLEDWPRVPYVALTFRVNSDDLDRWVIPLTMLGAGESRPNEQRSRSFTRPASSMPLVSATQVVRLDYVPSLLPGNRLDLRVQAPRTLEPFLKLLRAGEGGARLTFSNDAVVVYQLTLATDGNDRTLIAQATTDLLQRIDVLASRAAGRGGLGGMADTCAIDPQLVADQNEVSKVFARCVAADAQAVAGLIFPAPVQALLHDLARCRDPDAKQDDMPPALIAISGLGYIPLQFLPIDTGDTKVGCSRGLIARSPPESWPSGIDDDFLGLHLAVTQVPNDAQAVQFWNGAAAATPLSRYSPTTTLAGVYRDAVADAEDETTFGFNAFALYAADDLHATVRRDAPSFLERLLAMQARVGMVIINAHGLRGASPKAVDLRTSDSLVFSHIDSFIVDGGLPPDDARLTAIGLLRGFAKSAPLRRSPLTAGPTVLLLACDTAPYREGPGTIPYAFIALGARTVIVTEAEVPADLAQLFGRNFLRSATARAPPFALLEARRAVFRANRSILSLLWGIRSAEGTIR